MSNPFNMTGEGQTIPVSTSPDYLLCGMCIGVPLLLIVVAFVVYKIYGKHTKSSSSETGTNKLELEVGKTYGFLCYGKRMMGELIKYDEKQYHFMMVIKGTNRPVRFNPRAIEYIYEIYKAEMVNE